MTKEEATQKALEWGNLMCEQDAERAPRCSAHRIVGRLSLIEWMDFDMQWRVWNYRTTQQEAEAAVVRLRKKYPQRQFRVRPPNEKLSEQRPATSDARKQK